MKRIHRLAVDECDRRKGWGEAAAQEGIDKERLLQIIAVISQAAISRRVHPYKLGLRDRQATRGRGGGCC